MPDTLKKYLGMQILGESIGTYQGPRQGCMGELGPPLGLGTEQPGKAHGPFPPALLLGSPARACPALPRCYPYPIGSSIHPAHPSIHPPTQTNTIIHGPTHGTMMHPYPYQLTAQYIQVLRLPECHSFSHWAPPPRGTLPSVDKLERGLASIPPPFHSYMP